MEDESVHNATVKVEQSLPLNEESSYVKEQNEHDANKRLGGDGNEIVEEPKEGMIFSSLEEVIAYYKKYGLQKGFGVRKRTSKTNDDGKVKYLTLACFRTGKSKCKGWNLLKRNMGAKTQCMAKLNAILCPDGKFRVTTVVLEHNHALTTDKAQLILYDKKLESNMKKRHKINDEVGIDGNKNLNSPMAEDAGFESLPIAEKSSRDYNEKGSHLPIGIKDAEAIHSYFVKMQDKNSSFFYTVDFDDECRLRNLFWADGRSRAAYEAFGDVVTFDTTCLLNKYNMQLTYFLGTNHHGQAILLGCGLMSNADTKNFVWMLESWLACMSGRAPHGIITDQDKDIQKAVERVFPEVRHRWCLWHIMKKLPQKLRGYSKYELIKSTLENVVYDSLTQDEFEESWKNVVEAYGLQNNEWLVRLYDERHCWVPVYVKDTFWAGMSTIQHGESVYAFFDGYLNSKTTLKQFIEHYDSVLRSKVEKENQADLVSLNSCVPCITHYDMEKQLQGIYTNAKFKEFQVELRGKIYCELFFVKEEAGVSTYEVHEDVKIGEKTKDLVFIVHFNVKECEVQCMCHLFEFKGILCRHMIVVLNHKKEKYIPQKYILARWRKDLKRGYTRINISYSDWTIAPHLQRFHKMCNFFHKVAELGADSNDKFVAVIDCVKELKFKLASNDSQMAGRQKDGSVPLLTSNTSAMVNQIETQESINIDPGNLLGVTHSSSSSHFFGGSCGLGNDISSSSFDGNQSQGIDSLPTNYIGNQLRSHNSQAQVRCRQFFSTSNNGESIP